MKHFFYLLFLFCPVLIFAQKQDQYTYKIIYTADIKIDMEEAKVWIQKFTHADYLLLNASDHFVYIETSKPINKNIILNKLIKVSFPVIEIADFKNMEADKLTAEHKEKLKLELEAKVKELELKTTKK